MQKIASRLLGYLSSDHRRTTSSWILISPLGFITKQKKKTKKQKKQKQPSREVLKKRCSENTENTHAKVQSQRSYFATSLKSHPDTGAPLQIHWTPPEHLPPTTPPDGYFQKNENFKAKKTCVSKPEPPELIVLWISLIPTSINVVCVSIIVVIHFFNASIA